MLAKIYGHFANISVQIVTISNINLHCQIWKRFFTKTPTKRIIFIAACDARHNDIMWWMHEHVPIDHEMLQYSLNSVVLLGNVSMADWLITIDATWDIDPIFHEVAASGRLNVVEWLVQHGQLLRFIDVVSAAAENGHFDIIRWAVENHMKFNDIGTQPNANIPSRIGSCIHRAAMDGHKDIAEYLHSLEKSSE
ncbi:Hypothetical protein PHPALM_9215 [Phytophthora palmivora]|uniref:Ankyrin repeat protein n=1 Tax=Phytophthora palmivora TaxID=4796 RepID=A0A2P4Y7W0_9STRA|nr:Hypothetical protein PHPALM_9215 [Phytophthora palmivora]